MSTRDEQILSDYIAGEVADHLAEKYGKYTYTDSDQARLTISAIPDAGPIATTEPVISFYASEHAGDDTAVVYVRLADVDTVIAAIGNARDKLRALAASPTA